MEYLSVILVMTNACNLHCSYCYEHFKNSRSMSLSTAKTIISNIAKGGYKRVQIEFFGGEPLLQFELIKEVCEWAWTTYPQKFSYFVSTNGTLLKDDVLKWFISHKNLIRIGLSYDGTPQMNLANRGTMLNENLFRLCCDLWPQQSVKATISRQTLPTMAEGIIYLHNLGFKVNAELATGIDYSDEDYNLFERELGKLLSFYKENLDIEPFENLKYSLAPILDDETHEAYCGAGETTIAYDVDGKEYPCHMFIPISSGVVNSYNRKEIREDKSFYDDQDCKECVVRNICIRCSASNLIERGHIGCRNKKRCRFFIIERIYSAKYKIYKAMSKNVDSVSEDDYLEVKAAMKLLQHYNIEP